MTIEIPDILTSISTPQLIKDDIIKQAKFIELGRGQGVERYAGGFSVVFPCIAADGKKWAFRCWFNSLENLKERYEKFSNDIKKSKLPYFCDFTYVDPGICVNGQDYPTTRMNWIDGVTIKCRISHDR